MAQVEHSEFGVKLYLNKDEAENLTMVLAHIHTRGDYETTAVLEALISNMSIEELGHLVHGRDGVDLSLEPGLFTQLVKFTRK